MDKILVVIPVINLWDQYTIHCMESFYASKCDVPFEILIVNQCSTDMTVEKARDFGGRKMPGRVHVLDNKANTGCAGGWNQGVDYAIANGFTHIVIANNDILVAPGMLQAMYDRMKRDPHVLLCSAVDVIRELVVPQQVLDENHPVNKKADSEAPHPNFSCFMITPETIEKVGFFDEEYFPAYFEDNDYHYRLKLTAGSDCAIANTRAIFIHYGSRTQNQSGSAPVVSGPMFEGNRAKFARKWGGEPGHEQFTLPFNNSNNDLKYAKHTNQ